jgi:AMP nucleosidase
VGVPEAAVDHDQEIGPRPFEPMHGELKLKGMANRFYRERISQHLAIGLEAVRILREQGPDRLHSRKLRSFDEPAFR